MESEAAWNFTISVMDSAIRTTPSSTTAMKMLHSREELSGSSIRLLCEICYSNRLL